jgi:hypothetical protein
MHLLGGQVAMLVLDGSHLVEEQWGPPFCGVNIGIVLGTRLQHGRPGRRRAWNKLQIRTVLPAQAISWYHSSLDVPWMHPLNFLNMKPRYLIYRRTRNSFFVCDTLCCWSIL